MALEPLMNAVEVGKIVGWKKTRAHQALASGEIPAILISVGKRRSFRVRPSDLEKWLRSRQTNK